MDIVDILIKAIGNFVGDSMHDWADIVVTATPNFGSTGIAIMGAISCFFLIFMMEAGD